MAKPKFIEVLVRSGVRVHRAAQDRSGALLTYEGDNLDSATYTIIEAHAPGDVLCVRCFSGPEIERFRETGSL